MKNKLVALFFGWLEALDVEPSFTSFE